LPAAEGRDIGDRTIRKVSKRNTVLITPYFEDPRIAGLVEGTRYESCPRLTDPFFDEKEHLMGLIAEADEMVYVLTKECAWSSDYRAMICVSEEFVKGKKIEVVLLDGISLDDEIWDGLDFLRAAPVLALS